MNGGMQKRKRTRHSQPDWEATERLNLTAGVRYSHEKRTTESSFQLRIQLFGLDLFLPLNNQRNYDA